MSKISQDNTEIFINRELSWMEFNRMVLEEAQDPRHPLLERVKFLSIFSSNLDEFMMIRVSGLRRQKKAGVLESPPDGLTPTQQLVAIRTEVKKQIHEGDQIWRDSLLPDLNEQGIFIHRFRELNKKQKNYLRKYFEKEIFPALTPMAFDPGRPFPFISNLSLNLAAIIDDPQQGNIFSRVKIPRESFSRLVRIPPEYISARSGRVPFANEYHFVFIEDLTAANIDLLFPEKKIINCYPFIISRDADLEIEEDEASDLLTAIEESVEMRRIGSPVRLEVDRSMPKWVRNILTKKFDLSSEDVYTIDEHLRKSDLMQLTDIDRPDLKDKPFLPSYPCGLEDEEKNIFSEIKGGDILFYHPYDSFTPIVNFIRQAAEDPDVIAIKQTLYRTGPKSPIVQALMKARMNGKQVSVIVELKARFDEHNNIVWAKALERAGVHVVYGLMGIKVHAKMTMVVRREKDGLETYVHIGTGNYNPVTARVYTDFGIMTCDEAIASDVTDLFNALTGHSGKREFNDLLVSYGKTGKMRKIIIGLIEQEIEEQKKNSDGLIMFKLNQLVDPEIILALYRASQAGVKVVLQVRGICCLKPGMKNISENIECTSIVGRFLEHSRILYFGNGGKDILLTGSADMMQRNLNRRVEVLMEIRDENIKCEMKKILDIHLMDNVNSRELLSDGSYTRKEASGDRCDSQQWMIDHRGMWNEGHP
jgi:polyphosphate kinase